MSSLRDARERSVLFVLSVTGQAFSHVSAAVSCRPALLRNSKLSEPLLAAIPGRKKGLKERKKEKVPDTFVNHRIPFSPAFRGRVVVIMGRGDGCKCLADALPARQSGTRCR